FCSKGCIECVKTGVKYNPNNCVGNHDIKNLPYNYVKFFKLELLERPKSYPSLSYCHASDKPFYLPFILVSSIGGALVLSFLSIIIFLFIRKKRKEVEIYPNI